MKCPYCGNKIDISYKTCPYCYSDVTKDVENIKLLKDKYMPKSSNNRIKISRSSFIIPLGVICSCVSIKLIINYGRNNLNSIFFAVSISLIIGGFMRRKVKKYK